MRDRPLGTEGCGTEGYWDVKGSGMADTITRRSLAVDYFSRFKRRWQRTMAVEFALIALFIAFATFEISYFIGRMAS